MKLMWKLPLSSLSYSSGFLNGLNANKCISLSLHKRDRKERKREKIVNNYITRATLNLQKKKYKNIECGVLLNWLSHNIRIPTILLFTITIWIMSHISWTSLNNVIANDAVDGIVVMVMMVRWWIVMILWAITTMTIISWNLLLRWWEMRLNIVARVAIGVQGALWGETASTTVWLRNTGYSTNIVAYWRYLFRYFTTDICLVWFNFTCTAMIKKNILINWWHYNNAENENVSQARECRATNKCKKKVISNSSARPTHRRRLNDNNEYDVGGSCIVIAFVDFFSYSEILRIWLYFYYICKKALLQRQSAISGKNSNSFKYIFKDKKKLLFFVLEFKVKGTHKIPRMLSCYQNKRSKRQRAKK